MLVPPWFPAGNTVIRHGTPANAVAATAILGTSVDDGVSILAITAGTAFNAVDVTVVQAVGVSVATTATFDSGTASLEVSLGTDGAGAPDATKATPAIVAAAIALLAEWDATDDGTTAITTSDTVTTAGGVDGTVSDGSILYLDDKYLWVTKGNDVMDDTWRKLVMLNEDDSLSVAAISLADTSAEILKDGDLGLDTYGQLTIHDNIVTGGNPANGRLLKGSANLDVSDAQAADVFTELFECRIPIEWEALSPYSFWITGKVMLRFNASNWTGAENPAIGFWSPGASHTALKRTSYIQYDPTADIVEIIFQSPFTINGAGPAFVSPDTVHDGFVIVNEYSAGVLTQSITKMSQIGLITQKQAALQDNNLPLALWANIPQDAAGADCTGILSVESTLEIVS